MYLVVFYTVFLPQDRICFCFFLLPVDKDDILKVNVNVAVSYYFCHFLFFTEDQIFHLCPGVVSTSLSLSCVLAALQYYSNSLSLSLSLSLCLSTCSCSYFLLPLLNSLFLEFRDVRVINTSEGAEGSFGIVYFLQQWQERGRLIRAALIWSCSAPTWNRGMPPAKGVSASRIPCRGITWRWAVMQGLILLGLLGTYCEYLASRRGQAWVCVYLRVLEY